MVELPEWYRSERESEKTIETLSSLNELQYYIKNSDEYIRRLAIVRLSKLQLKGSNKVLHEILEDDLESYENKLLAAWAFKKTAVGSNMEFFYNNKLLDKFTGSEGYDSLFTIYSDEKQPPLKFNLNFNKTSPDLTLVSSDISVIREANFSAEIDIRQWFTALLHSTATAISSSIKAKLFRIGKAKRSWKRPMIIEMKRGPGLFELAGKILFNLLYFIFLPIRLIRKYKLSFILILAAFYCFFAFTVPGRIFASQYMGIELIKAQNKTLQAVTQIADNIWFKFKGTRFSLSRPGQPDVNDLYIVTAAKGLNLRKAPDTTAELAGASIPCGNVVVFLQKSFKDGAGRLWYYIRTPDGRIGWVSSKFLSDSEG